MEWTWDLSLWCQSRRGEGSEATGRRSLSDLGPWNGARVASQQSPILRPGHVYCSRRDCCSRKKKETPTNEDSTRLFDPSCLKQLEIPPVWANSNATVDVVTYAMKWCKPATRRVVWSGPYGEEFAPDKSASATTRQSLSRTT